MFNKDTDYVNNWMEKAMLLVADCIHEGLSEEDTIDKLKDQFKIADDSISLILAAGVILFQDEQSL